MLILISQYNYDDWLLSKFQFIFNFRQVKYFVERNF